MIRIGLVGVGATVSIAHFHAEGYKRDARCVISAVYDVNRPAAEKWVADHGLNARVCDSYEELLENCDAVDLCTPNRFHYPHGKQALKAGRHLLLEKPMAIRLEECEELAALARQTGSCSMIGMVYRYANPVRLAKKLVREQLGRIYTFTAWTGGKRLANPKNPLEWRMVRALSGSGALGDFGSHLVDLALYVAQQRYDTVTCQLDTFIKQRAGADGSPQPVENDDAAVFTANGPNGLGSYTVSRVGQDDIMLLMAGQGGMLQVSLRSPDKVLLWEKDPQGCYKGGVTEVAVEPQKFFDGWFYGETSAFLDGIEGDRSDIPDLSQGLYVERVLFAAEEAARTGRTQEVAT